MLEGVASAIHVFLMILSAAMVQADDVSIYNNTKYPAQFRVRVQSTGYDRTVTLQPEEKQNAIGTDLWHNAIVVITATTPNTPECGVVISEVKAVTYKSTFYLPAVSMLVPNTLPLCMFRSNLPNCGCWEGSADPCPEECGSVSNAQVVVWAVEKR